MADCTFQFYSHSDPGLAGSKRLYSATLLPGLIMRSSVQERKIQVMTARMTQHHYYTWLRSLVCQIN